MAHSSSRWIPLIVLAFAVPLAACGGSSTPSGTSAPATAAPTPTAAAIATTAAASTCPSGGTVGSALGTTLPDPTGITSPSGNSPLPPGATDINCDYHTTSENVIISILTGIPSSYISKFSAEFPVAFTPVSGVGDVARSFSQALGSGENNEGLVAVKGSTVVALVATATPATLSQIEALVNSLL